MRRIKMAELGDMHEMLKEIKLESEPIFVVKTMNDWLKDAHEKYKSDDWLLNAANTADPYCKNNKRKKRKSISITTRYKLLVEANFKCRCGRSPATHPGCALEIDHIIPVSKGGTNDESNLQVLCFQCNRGKRDNIF